MKQALLVPVVASLGACATVPPPAPAASSCPLIGSSDWAAWINAMPGPDARPKLIVTGKATVPTGGYRFALSGPTVLRSEPVQVHLMLEQLPASGGPVTQAVVTHDIRGEWPMSPPVGSVTVRCGDRTLAIISPVVTAS